MTETMSDGELRALDREIAELLGWWLDEDDEDSLAPFCWVRPDGGYELGGHPRYSSTWEGFGLLVEECERRGWKPTILPYGPDAKGFSGYECSIEGEHARRDDTYPWPWAIEADMRHVLAYTARDAFSAAFALDKAAKAAATKERTS